ncbi:MAG: hypothetical protein K0S07_120 [Chlamydiales bacterium]|jgi:hypothetical protein|nr:hypothetical protein [Chlamydiales bacterium]
MERGLSTGIIKQGWLQFLPTKQGHIEQKTWRSSAPLKLVGFLIGARGFELFF